MQGVLALLALLAVLAPASTGPAETRQQPWSDTRARIAAGGDERVSDAEIRRRIIQESIDAYDGPCACPYQSARNGSRCGRRSAYDRAGGEAPLCFPRDVSDDMVRGYRAEHGL